MGLHIAPLTLRTLRESYISYERIINNTSSPLSTINIMHTADRSRFVNAEGMTS